MGSEAGGPYVQMAAICERALEGKDGVWSIIRVVDRFTVTASGPSPPEEMPPAIIKATIAIMLKSGFARGRYNLRVVPTSPSGKQSPDLNASVLLEGDDRGVTVILDCQMQVQEEGVYWFAVLLQDQLLTRIPLRVLYAPGLISSLSNYITHSIEKSSRSAHPSAQKHLGCAGTIWNDITARSR